MVKETYGVHSDKSIAILLEHNGYDVNHLRKLPQTERVNVVVEASYNINEWLRDHFVYMRLVELGKRILTAVNANE